jgi:hypothetical protein
MGLAVVVLSAFPLLIFNVWPAAYLVGMTLTTLNAGGFAWAQAAGRLRWRTMQLRPAD